MFEMVAIHNKALSAAEVQQNFEAGTGNFVTLAVRRVEHPRQRRARIDMLAAQVDDKSYVFAKPTFVSARDGDPREEHSHRGQRRRAGRRAGLPPRRYDRAWPRAPSCRGSAP